MTRRPAGSPSSGLVNQMLPIVSRDRVSAVMLPGARPPRRRSPPWLWPPRWAGADRTCRTRLTSRSAAPAPTGTTRPRGGHAPRSLATVRRRRRSRLPMPRRNRRSPGTRARYCWRIPALQSDSSTYVRHCRNEGAACHIPIGASPQPDEACACGLVSARGGTVNTTRAPACSVNVRICPSRADRRGAASAVWVRARRRGW
jgi:hypothetical protein